MRVHVAPGVDARIAAADLLSEGMVVIDDIGENLHDLVSEEILDELGHVADGLDILEQRVDTRLGPVFILRAASLWSAAKARAAVLRELGAP